MSHAKKFLLYILRLQLFLQKLVFLMIKIWFCEVTLLTWNLIYSPAFATFDEITWSKRIPNFSLTVSTYKNAKLRCTSLDTFTVETDKWMCVCRHRLWCYTSLTCYFPNKLKNFIHFGLFGFVFFFHNSFNSIFMYKYKSIDLNLFRLKIITRSS